MTYSYCVGLLVSLLESGFNGAFNNCTVVHAKIQKIALGVSLTSSTYFHGGPNGPPREAIGPEGSNCFSIGVRTSMSMEKITL